MRQVCFYHRKQSGCCFFHLDSKIFYEVPAITEPVSKIVPNYPVVIETAIFNFDNKLICDGIINQKVLLGGNMTGGFIAEYHESVKRGTVRKKL